MTLSKLPVLVLNSIILFPHSEIRVEFDREKDKELISLAESYYNKNILIVVEELTENVILSTRNIPNVVLLQANEINTLDIVASDNLVITKEAVKQIEEVLA